MNPQTDGRSRARAPAKRPPHTHRSQTLLRRHGGQRGGQHGGGQRGVDAAGQGPGPSGRRRRPVHPAGALPPSRCDCHAHSPLLPDAVLLRAQRLPRPELDALDRPRWDVEDSTVTRQYRRVRGPSTPPQPRARHSRWALAPGTDADRAPGVQLSLCCHPDKNETEDAALAFHRAPRVLGSPGRRWLKRVRVAGRRPRRGARPAARSRRADEAAAGHARCGRQVVDHAVR